jgi:hypothetical protein
LRLQLGYGQTALTAITALTFLRMLYIQPYRKGLSGVLGSALFRGGRGLPRELAAAVLFIQMRKTASIVTGSIPPKPALIINLRIPD